MSKKEIERLELGLTESRQQILDLKGKFHAVVQVAQHTKKDESHVPLFFSRMSKLDEYFSEYEKVQSTIREYCVKLDKLTDYEKDVKIATQLEEYYYYCLAVARELNESRPPDESSKRESVGNTSMIAHSSTGGQVSFPDLPKIPLPSFNGNLSDWPSYYDSFKSLIHRNPAISDLGKFYYLRSSLQGPALSTIKSIPLISANYELAWTALLDRFENKRVLANNYLDKILKFKINSDQSLNNLHLFMEVFYESAAALKRMQIPNLDDFLLLSLALKSLDSKTTTHFESECSDSEFPTFDKLISFIKKQCRILELTKSENVYINKNKFHKEKDMKNTPVYKRAFISTTERSSDSNRDNNNCPQCNASHKLQQCPLFLKLSPFERREIVKTLKRCYNCLGSHLILKCNSQHRCSSCNRKHHSLIHFDAATNVTPPTSTPRSPPHPCSSSGAVSSSTNTVQALHAQGNHTPSVLLGTALILVKDGVGTYQPVRCVVDSGSQLSFISEACAKRLHLPTRKYQVPVEGLGESTVSARKGIVSCSIRSRLPDQPELFTKAVILKKISSNLPTTPLSSKLVSQFSDKFLADPQFIKPGPIDFLLGADLWPLIFPSGKTEILAGQPSICFTIFGWIVIGKVQETSTNGSISLLSINNLNSALRRFWEIEEVNIPITSISPQDLKCEEHFLSTHTRNEEGRYIVELPFKSEETPLFGNSRSTALAQFQRLESRLCRNPQLKFDYSEVLQDYLNNDHMEKSDSPGAYVIPHHCVIRENSCTTKVRIVFNASSKQPPFKSLNEYLHVGPKLQKDITDIISNFRTHAVTLCADIRQMYRQILVAPYHRKYQHILWRDSPADQIQEYQLKTVTFGVSASPYLAMRVIKQLVVDEGNSYPEASQVLLNDILVDDIVSGANNLENALKLKSQLTSLLELGGFSLRKWMSNNLKLLEDIPETDRIPVVSIDDSENSLKILGIQWDPISDNFGFKVAPIKVKFTKRGLLSMVASLYDPLGWLSPLILMTKHLIQKLWLIKCEWDEDLPPSEILIWQNIIDQFPSLKNIKIQRFILTSPPYNCQIVGFCDASEKGYSAVIYLRCANSQNGVQVHLIKAKSKVSPLKTLTIPRLELCGALLLARTLKSIQPLLERVNVNHIRLFSDSTIVLSWLRTPSHLLKTFVANRVVEILDCSAQAQWSHIASFLNPADCASRGLLPLSLVSNSSWWQGPEFLLSPLNTWPEPPDISVDLINLPDIKPIQSSFLASLNSDIVTWLDQFSSLLHLKRVFAYVLRFLSNCRHHPTQREVGPLTPTELDESVLKLAKLVQEKHFAEELKSIRKGTAVGPRLIKLSPYLDSSGLLRVGGRLENSLLPEESKHPVLLPKSGRFTCLIIDDFHRSSHHSGPRTVQGLISQKFWILSAKSVIRNRIRKCFNCFRFLTPPLQPKMCSLPIDRVRPSKPFLKVGCDFGGPFVCIESKLRKSRHIKSYFCIFVCLVTKAIHLEAVSDLSTPAFLAAFDRFIARRGRCIEVVSDCGTNFIGASRHLKELYEFLNNHDNQKGLFDGLSHKGLHWKFNCPNAPHFNGLSEAGVKSTKTLLRRTVGDRPLTFEELTTILCNIEAVLNSRPLCSLSDDPKEIDYLTPGHFLVGSALVSNPQFNFEQTPSNKLSRWQLVQQVTQHFWRRWSLEYLHTLQQRAKWTTNKDQLEPGDLVLIKEQNTSPTQWPVGRVEAVHPGKDAVIRVANVRTRRGTYLRPLVKLVPVPSSN